jgi:hypothetical protein
MILRKTMVLLLASPCLIALVGCEVGTSIRVVGGPSFSLDGSGRLASFNVYGPRAGYKIATPLDSKSLVWSIQPVSGSTSGLLVADMNLAYGSVPKGYEQTVPSGGAALPLTTGQVYAFIAETTGAQGAQGFFYMDKTGPIQVSGGPCPSEFVGNVKPVKCGTNEAFVEPKDLEEFVRENRVQK